MAHCISFSTGRFDVSKERPNPVNPIAGQSVLIWLREELSKAGYTCSEPDTEDWGWYMDVTGGGSTYLVGASADAGPGSEPAPAVLDWVVQVHKHRSVTEKLLGRNTLTADDPLVALIEGIARADPALQDVSVDRDE